MNLRSLTAALFVGTSLLSVAHASGFLRGSTEDAGTANAATTATRDWDVVRSACTDSGHVWDGDSNTCATECSTGDCGCAYEGTCIAE